MADAGRTWTYLKSDLMGRVERGHSSEAQPTDGWPVDIVRRDTRLAPWWCRWLARWLARREARCLQAVAQRLPSLAGVSLPQVCQWQNGVLIRTWIEGEALQLAPPPPPDFFEDLRRLVCQLHRAGITHNDLAKEPNCLVDEHGRPALVDFQLGKVFARRGRIFRLMAREDLRHLLKHKRSYAAQELSARELQILARPSCAARLWKQTGKRLYHGITRGIFGWSDREGAGDRNFTTRR